MKKIQFVKNNFLGGKFKKPVKYSRNGLVKAKKPK